ncbi:restriction endonuclease [Microbacterium esteraromaticum]|uniref:Restriction endonuclease n=1 Tax=Microbacterium esteraromaticum TaxID=57043 RepID=A0A939DTF8_9MICO|nr:restriction endonuclease [Microbacterium esteraromaticum]MBN8204851.1 restriction endonuclease [Microbacterium esteraromaticum]MBN8415005.1 restriction endonuclease [Microbacterium esteraromaticum]MBN8424718.1 restriction endonuclease [Microbacterium esteraromaticum]
MNVWGVHNDSLTNELVDEGFISIGWDRLGALSEIRQGREGLKRALTNLDPDAKPRSIAGQAGVLVRFRDEMKPGDVVVAPYKPTSTINIGVLVGDYYYDASAGTHRHRRRVEWRKTELPRTVFSQSALYEIGSVLTVFRVRNHAEEFLAALEEDGQTVEQLTHKVDQISDERAADEESDDEPRASRIERHTRDFVLNALHRKLTHQEFEEFTAELLRVLGYQARVTQYSQDGGVDVIAHRDPLGVEPPQIKVQCKHHTGTISAPEVQQLVGTQGPNELSLFVTLGNYSRDARMIERQRTGLRLLSGEDVVSLVLEHYSDLPESRRALMPLTPVLVVADAADV